MPLPAIEITSLTVRYDNGPDLLRDFSLSVGEGECVAIQGESGCGKSTLLHCICGLIPSSIHAELSGTVRIFGRPVAELPRQELVSLIGIMFQNPDTQLFCDTVEDEIAFGMENICLPRDEMAARINDALKLTGLERYRLTSPNKLSGGQKQLVVLAAVMALQPKILLLDESFSQLDSCGKSKMLEHIHLLKQQGQTLILVDHDAENLFLADRVVLIGGEPNADSC